MANEIATADVREVLSQTPTRSTLRTDRGVPKAVTFYRPLEIDPGVPIRCGGAAVATSVRVYDVGVITVTFRTPPAGRTWDDWRRFHSPLADDGRDLSALAVGICADVCRELRPVMTQPGAPTEPEAYTVFALSDLGGAADTTLWLAENRRQVAGLLSDSPADRLSEAQVEDVLRLRRTYDRGDLVVLDWDAALVIDLSAPGDDVLYVIELANLQLVEYRALDQLLDRYLNEAYPVLDRSRSAWRRVPAVLQRLRRIRVDLTKLADEATHITKFVGDWYLARVYLAAHERFALDRWRASVDSRLTQLDRIYTLVQSEVHDRRMLLLEAAIVVLFVIDLLAVLVWKR